MQEVRFTSFLMIHGAPLNDKALNNPDREVTLLTNGPTVTLGLRKDLFHTAPAKDNLIVEHEAVVMDHFVCRALSDEVQLTMHAINHAALLTADVEYYDQDLSVFQEYIHWKKENCGRVLA